MQITRTSSLNTVLLCTNVLAYTYLPHSLKFHPHSLHHLPQLRLPFMKLSLFLVGNKFTFTQGRRGAKVLDIYIVTLCTNLLVVTFLPNQTPWTAILLTLLQIFQPEQRVKSQLSVRITSLSLIHTL